MKYEIGDSLRINIKGYTQDIAANVDDDGNSDPIKLYIIGSTEEGRPRYVSEEVLDGIVQMGADVFSSELASDSSDDDLVEVQNIIPGTTIEVGGIQMEILDIAYPAADEHVPGALCLAKDVLFDKAFDEDNCNDWSSSTLREYLNGEFKDSLAAKIGENALLPFERDLLSDDGIKDYAGCVDYVSLISCDEYRTYRGYISYKSGWWWTLTPWSCYESLSRNVRYVGSDGSLNSFNAYYGNGGVAPAFLLLPSLRAKIVEDKED